MLKVIWNGVSPVVILIVVLYAHKILGSSSGHIPFAPSSQVLIILSKDRFVTSPCPLTNSGCGCLILDKTVWMLSCRTVIHCQKWGLMGSRIDTLLPSKQSFRCSFWWWWPTVLNLPIWWSNRWLQPKTSAIVVQLGMVLWCLAFIVRRDMVPSWAWVSCGECDKLPRRSHLSHRGTNEWHHGA